jgi:hypothetical protein
VPAVRANVWEKLMSSSVLKLAAEFIWNNARLLDRRRFAYHFLGEPSGAVRYALRAFANPDGGFGHGLEADLRTPHSQPVAVGVALAVLVEVGIEDRDFLVRCCEFLASVSRDDGSVPIVVPNALEHAHARHWGFEWPADSPNPTAGIAGWLHALGVRHRWLDRATDWCWQRVERPMYDAHDVREMLTFLEHAPDRERARRSVEPLRLCLDNIDLFHADPNADGYVLTPLFLAPSPDSIAREWFDDDLLDAHLSALRAKQLPDGGWPLNWTPPSDAAVLEWRGSETLQALITLRAWEQLYSPAEGWGD